MLSRTRQYSPHLAAIHDVVIRETSNPTTRRGRSYLAELKDVVAILELANCDDGRWLREPIDALCECIRKRGSLRRADVAFAAVAPRLRASIPSSDFATVEDDRLYASGLVEDLYLHFLTAPDDPLDAAREAAKDFGMLGS